MSFGFGKKVDMDFDTAIDKVTEELQKEGFGVLSDIDVAAKMKEKLERDMPDPRSLSPQFSHHVDMDDPLNQAQRPAKVSYEEALELAVGHFAANRLSRDGKKQPPNDDKNRGTRGGWDDTAATAAGREFPEGDK